MKIASMRQRVTLQSFTVTGRDAYGSEVRAWSDVDTYWAEVTMLSGREAVNAQQIQAEATHQVRMRRVTAIAADQRFLFSGRKLNILSVNDVDFRGREYLILCSEVAS